MTRRYVHSSSLTDLYPARMAQGLGQTVSLSASLVGRQAWSAVQVLPIAPAPCPGAGRNCTWVGVQFAGPAIVDGYD